MKKVLPLIVVLAACQTAPKRTAVYDHCAIFNQKKWQLTSPEEPLVESLLSMAYSDPNSNKELSFEGERVTDVWFKNNEGGLKLCRYEAIDDSCSSASVTLEFHLIEGSYQPAQVMEKVCMVHSYRT